MMTGDEDLLTGFRAEYRRAVTAAHAAAAKAQQSHAALFDFSAECGRLVRELVGHDNPLGLGVRFVRRAPPHLDAPAGVLMEDAPKDRQPSFAAVVLETPDLWFEIRSDPSAGIEALTNVPELEATARSITVLPDVNVAPQLLEVFLLAAGNTYALRAGME